MTHEHTPPETGCTPEEQSAWHAGIDAGRDIERGNAAAQEPVAWVAADTLNSPHPTCISSLAYMSQIDQERGREYVPLTIIDRYAAPVAAQPAVNGYTCTVPDDCETLHWRGQILSMNELASVARLAASAGPVNRQAIADRFAFLEGVVNEHNYRLIVDTACALAAHKPDDGDAKDAERCRWLRVRWGRIADVYDGDTDQIVEIREADDKFEGWDVSPESLDNAIDAAMRAGQSGEQK